MKNAFGANNYASQGKSGLLQYEALSAGKQSLHHQHEHSSVHHTMLCSSIPG